MRHPVLPLRANLSGIPCFDVFINTLAPAAGIELRQNQCPFGGTTFTAAFQDPRYVLTTPHQVQFDFPDKKWHKAQRYIHASQLFSPVLFATQYFQRLARQSGH
ncbi:hypothetical protein OH690_10455 [Escherichia coli]|nr:hypothetical protein [Escherichia coli]